MMYFTNKNELNSVILYFVPKSRQKIREAEFDLNDIREASNASRGTKLHAKPVSKMKIIKKPQAKTVKSGKSVKSTKTTKKTIKSSKGKRKKKK